MKHYFLSKEKCQKLRKLNLFKPPVKGDFVYISYDKWVNVDSNTKKFQTVSEIDVYVDTAYFNIKYNTTPAVLKIPSIAEFMYVLDADLKTIDYINNTIISTRKVNTGYRFNNSIKAENIKIDGENIYEAFYNFTMLLYAKEDK